MRNKFLKVIDAPRLPSLDDDELTPAATQQTPCGADGYHIRSVTAITVLYPPLSYDGVNQRKEVIPMRTQLKGLFLMGVAMLVLVVSLGVLSVGAKTPPSDLAVAKWSPVTLQGQHGTEGG